MNIYIFCKVTIWNGNCAQATTFILDSRLYVRVKVSKFLRQRMSRHEEDSNLEPSDSYRMLQPFELSGPEFLLIQTSC